jgi:hypothetical protein
MAKADIPDRRCEAQPQGADPLPLPLRVAKAGRNHFQLENYPPPPHWDRRAIKPNHIIGINESDELSQGALYLIHYSDSPAWSDQLGCAPPPPPASHLPCTVKVPIRWSSECWAGSLLL